MANTKQAIKRIKTSEKARVRNAANKSRIKTFIKNAKKAIEANSPNALEKINLANKELDKGIKKNTIHAKNAARRKARLMNFYNKHQLQQSSLTETNK